MPETRTVTNLIDETEIRDVRLVGVHAEVRNVPAEMSVEFNIGQVGVKQSDDEIIVHFEHNAEFADGNGESTASISLMHVVRCSYSDDIELNEELVSAWVFGNVYFMVYPYVRQALQDTCLRLDLPPVVLGYLKRDQLAPASVTLVVTQTALVQRPGEEEPLPFDEAVEE